MADENFDASRTISQFLEATAAKRPAPGGGSATALAGALASAIGEMVLNYSVGKKELAEHEPALKGAIEELRRARAMMLELMVEDQVAFAALTNARKNARGQGDRDSAFAAALLGCIRVPQAIGATAWAVLDLCGQLAPIVNKYLLSDLAVCAELSMATLRCAAYNVRVNLSDVSDPAEHSRFEDMNNAMVWRATARIQQVIPAIWSRLNG
jgi:glutamate formiminotransferase/formiminotetrahydrofolate cyclodeaminase